MASFPYHVDMDYQQRTNQLASKHRPLTYHHAINLLDAKPV